MRFLNNGVVIGNWRRPTPATAADHRDDCIGDKYGWQLVYGIMANRGVRSYVTCEPYVTHPGVSWVEDFVRLVLKSLETYCGVAIMFAYEAADLGGFRAALNKARRLNDLRYWGLV